MEAHAGARSYRAWTEGLDSERRTSDGDDEEKRVRREEDARARQMVSRHQTYHCGALLRRAQQPRRRCHDADALKRAVPAFSVHGISGRPSG